MSEKIKLEEKLENSCCDCDPEEVIAEEVVSSEKEEESNMYKWAKRELDIAGFTEYSNDYAKSIRDCVLSLMKLFTDQGHSGHSAPYVIKIFERLASWTPLTPLTLIDEEFGEPYTLDGSRQNNRYSGCFCEKDGTMYDIHTFTKRVVRSKKVGSDEIIDIPKEKQICWSGFVNEMKDGVPTGRGFGHVVFTDKVKKDGYIVPDEPIILDCLEVEIVPDGWEMFAEASEIQEKLGNNPNYEILWKEEPVEYRP